MDRVTSDKCNVTVAIANISVAKAGDSVPLADVSVAMARVNLYFALEYNFVQLVRDHFIISGTFESTKPPLC
jgi:hypothetical protein